MKFSQVFKAIFLFIFWLFLNGCATTSTSIESPPSDIPPKVAKVSVIQNISFVEDKNYTRIQIEGSEILEPPFYKLLLDPLRITIDVPNIDLKQIKEPVKIDNGTITEVTSTQFDDKGRIEIGLAQMTNYNILKEDKNLVIDIEKVKNIAVAKEEPKEEVKKEEEVVTVKVADIAPPELKKKETPMAQPTEKTIVPIAQDKAKTILNVLLKQKRDFVTFNIVADGKIENYNTFKLDSPSRLVLDILEVGTQYHEKSIKVKNPFIKVVRIGQHPDKLRIVFDSLKAQLPLYQINKMDNKLMVSFGNVPQPSEPQILIETKTVEKVFKKENQVKAPVEFKQMEQESRIMVSLTEEPIIESQAVSKDTITVDIKNAYIPKHFQKPINTSSFESAVKNISMQNVKLDKANVVRISIKLNEEAAFKTIKDGSTLFIDIEKPKKVEVEVEPVPPLKKEKLVAEVQKEAARKSAENTIPELEKIEKAVTPIEVKPVPLKQAENKIKEKNNAAEQNSQEKIYSGRKLSLDFKDADIKNILRLIAEVSNFNIIAGDDVSGKITMRLVDVPWEQALDVILQAKGLGMNRVGNVIRIAPVESLKKEVQTELEAKRTKEKLEDLVSELIPVNYATAKEILPQVKSILSERGDVKVDERTNILIVKDILRNIEGAKNLVKSLDTKTPQVLIEARIVEATLTFQRNLGISWGFMAGNNTDNKNVSTVGGGTGSTSTLRGTDVSTRKIVNLPATLPTGAPGAVSIFEFLFTSESGLKNLDIAISAYENKGDANVISSPKIATLDNKEASIEQGLRIPYTKQTESGTSEDFIEANLKLLVTPHVTNDGHIRMNIKVKKDEPNYAHVSASNTPSIDKNEANTEVLVKDNGVVAIGGIYTIKKNTGNTGVPLFSKIPVLGWLFKNETKTDERKDLLIFISPKIFKDQAL